MTLPTGLNILAAVVAGPLLGSFAATAIERSLAGREFVWARSRCRHCRAGLAPRDLIPVLSWSISGGRCRRCGEAISPYYPAVELAFLALPLWAWFVVPDWLVVPTAVFGWLLLTLAIFDLRAFVLPDPLTFPLIAAGLATMAWVGGAWPIDQAIGAAAGAAALWIIAVGYRSLRGWEGLGRGDIKLAAGLGAWLGWQGLPSAILVAAVAGLTLAAVNHLIRRDVGWTDRLPFGAYLALGGWLTWLYGPLLLG